jgi:hypothetical protein
MITARWETPLLIILHEFECRSPSPSFLEPSCPTSPNRFTSYRTHSWNIPVALFILLVDASHPEPVFFFWLPLLSFFSASRPWQSHNDLGNLRFVYSLLLLFYVYILLWCMEWIINQFRRHLTLSLRYTIINCAHLVLCPCMYVFSFLPQSCTKCVIIKLGK